MKTRPAIYALGLIIVAVVWTVALGSAHAQGPQLILHYDFEDGTVNDLSGYEEDADGVLVGLGSIVDSGDPDRGMVVDTESLGFGAEVDAVRKMDFRNSFTLQGWYKTANGIDGIDAWQMVAGRGGSGPRIFNHWGLGGLGTAQLFNTEYNLFDGFTPVEIVSPSGFVDGSTWHHQLVTWNAATQQLWGYYDGFDGGDPTEKGLSPVDTLGDILVTHGNVPFVIGGFTQQSATALKNSQVDDVALWQGYAPPAVVQGLFDGTIDIEDAAAMMELPTQSADFDADNDRDGADFLTFQRGFGMDDISTPGEDDPGGRQQGQRPWGG